MPNLKESLRQFFICIINRSHTFEDNVCKICGAEKGKGRLIDVIRDLRQEQKDKKDEKF